MTAAPEQNASRQPADALSRLARDVRVYFLLAALTALACLPGFFSMPPLDRDESRYAQATAQMLETRDFVRIQLQDEPRNKKPIGIHWLQAASVAMFAGEEPRRIWAYRLPSMMGAVAAVIFTFWAGAHLVGRRAALVGASLFAVCFMLSTEGMLAKTDAMLAAMTALTMAGLSRLYVGRGDARANALIAWGALGAGILIKGPITPLVAVGCIAMLWLWERRIGWTKPLLQWRGPALFLLIVAPWLIAIGVATQGAFFRDALQNDLAPKILGGAEHRALPPGVHTALAPMLIFPATLGLIPAMMIAFHAMRAPHTAPEHAGIRFLVSFIVPFWAVMELSSVKLIHYTLPVFGAIALLAGAGLERWRSHGASLWARGASVLLFAIGAGALAGFAAYFATFAPGTEAQDVQRAQQTYLFLAFLIAAAAVILMLNKREWIRLATAIGLALILLVAVRERAIPQARDVFISREASSALLRADLSTLGRETGLPLLVVGYREPSIVFMTRTDTLLKQAEEAAILAAPTQPALIASRERAAFETALQARGLAFRPIGPDIGGRNYSNGEDVRLQPGRIVSVESDANP
jgi:4-amino-4-deoxy-L-arabinose transferase-like glycosyltransferase